MTDSVERDEVSTDAETGVEDAAADVGAAAGDVVVDDGSEGTTAGSESGAANDGSADPEVGEGEDTELIALREEFESLNDRHLRLVAEFDNFRRRSANERLAAGSHAQAQLVEKFLDVLDDLHRVAELDLTNATVEAIMEGIDLVERKFVRALGEASVEMHDPSGEAFNPEVMEAMMRVPAESDDQVDYVAQVFQKGYSLKGILVRPARVSVYTQG